MKNKKNVVLAVLFIFLVILTIVIINRSNKKWEQVSQVYMNDFNGDGKKQEMLLIYSPCDSDKGRTCETSSAIRLIDVETKEELWTSNGVYSYDSGNKRIALKDSVFAILYQGKYGSSYYEKKGVEGFSCKTGEKLWEYSLGQQRRSDHFCWMIQHEKNIFVLSQITPDTLCITSLDIMTGEKNLDVSVKSKSFKAAPYFASDKMIISSDCDVYAFDLHTGETFNISNNEPYEAVFSCDDGSQILVQETGIIQYDTSKVLIKKFTSEQKELIDETDQLSVYNDHLIYITNRDKHSRIGSLSIFADEETKQFVFEDELYKEFVDYWLTKNNDRGISGFDRIIDRFIPLVFTKYEEKIDVNKLVIFDLYSNKVFQESELMYSPSFSFNFRNVFYHKGYYIIMVVEDLPDHEQNEWIICMSGKTGKFNKAVRLNSEEGYNIPILIWDGFEMFADNYFYASQGSDFWCLSYPDLELVYTNNSDLKVIDAKDEIDNMFGEMEWE